MKLSFQHERTAASPIAPTRAEFPPLSGADIAGMVQGQRMGGDLYHFLRANRCRVIFGMLDVAGRHEENHSIVEAARRTFQEIGQEKFAYEEINEADAMMELCLELNLSIRTRRRRSAFLRGLRWLLQRGTGHDLLCQCRSHSGTAAGSFGHYRAPGDGLAAWPVFRVDLRGSNSRAAEGRFAAAGFAWRSGSSAQAQEGRVRAGAG